MQKVEIRIKGHIKDQWSGWFDGLIMSHSDPDETILTGIVSDQGLCMERYLIYAI